MPARGNGKFAQRDDVDRIAKGQISARALEQIEPKLAAREKAIMTSIFNTLKAREILAPEVAIQAWQQLFEVRELCASLAKDVREGGRAHERIEGLKDQSA